MSRRDEIVLDRSELAELLDENRVAVVGSLAPNGWPHLMPLWYVPREGEVWVWTYAGSQKVRNLERDPRATVLVEMGETYEELRGAMFEAEAELHRDAESVLDFAERLTVRYGDGLAQIGAEGRSKLEAQAAKRVAIRFKVRRTASWDHRKLGGRY